MIRIYIYTYMCVCVCLCVFVCVIDAIIICNKSRLRQGVASCMRTNKHTSSHTDTQTQEQTSIPLKCRTEYINLYGGSTCPVGVHPSRRIHHSLVAHFCGRKLIYAYYTALRARNPPPVS